MRFGLASRTPLWEAPNVLWLVGKRPPLAVPVVLERAYTGCRVRRLRSATQAGRAHPGVAAILSLGVAWGLITHPLGWTQTAHFAQVRALAEGQAEIDPWHWETQDKAWVDGHFYSVKAPGVAAVSLPFYLAIDATGLDELARQTSRDARQAGRLSLTPQERVQPGDYGFDPERARATNDRVIEETPIVWALTLVVAVVPAVLLLFGVRWVADRMEPGYGTAAAVTLGLGTIVMTFAAAYFSHVISAALGFAAFALLMRERQGPPRPRLLAVAGLLAGLAVTFEYQVGLVGVILLFYALARPSGRTRRALTYGAGAVIGAAPALLFNLWALGSPLEFAYGSAVAEGGYSGHDRLGLNSVGLFGITAPRLDGAVELLLSNRGLLTLTPIVALAVAGLVPMRRRGHRAEANVIAAIAIAYFAYNAGYWLPMGGGTPGPRFLFPTLPFLALGLAFAYRWTPAITLALAIPSAALMLAATITYPMLGEDGTGTWWAYIEDGILQHTVATALVSSAWLAIAPVIGAVLLAVVLAGRATPTSPIPDLRPAAAVVLAWAALAVVGPTIAGDDVQPLDGDPDALWLVGIATALALAGLVAIRVYQQLSPVTSSDGGVPGAPSVDERHRPIEALDRDRRGSVAGPGP
jgi:hypothetical protein